MTKKGLRGGRLPVLLSAVWLTLATGPSAAASPVTEIPAGIDHSGWDALLKRYVDARGLVDYPAWKSSREDVDGLDRYLAQFAPVPAAGAAAAGAERAAALINAYNAFTIQWVLRNYPTESVRLLDDSWDGRRHRVGGKLLSLEDIEHKMLRPAIGWKVHSTIVCAARSCPPLQREAFVAGRLDDQIDEAFRIWLARADLNRFLPDQKKVEVSKVFDWFEDDFKAAGGVKAVLARYGPPAHSAFLRSGNYKVKYAYYHWGLNDQSGRGSTYKHSFLKGLF